MGFFGSSKKPSTSNTTSNQQSTNSSATMFSTIETLQKRQMLLEKKIELELGQAKDKLSKNDQRGAKMCLRRKKTYEEQLELIYNQQAKLEMMQMKIESASLDVEVFTAQKAGASQIQRIYGGLSAEQIDQQIDQVRETMDNARDISDALAQPLGDEIDDADLDAELEELQQEELDKEATKVKSAQKAQTKQKAKSREDLQLEKELAALKAPTGKGKAPVQAAAEEEEEEDDEDAELRKLQAELA
eukprot:ANDGO_05650.mRNA.1 Vacuolar-sorting protein SNF7